jgi:proteasome lid subunit RPN8/RPN11
MNGFNPKLSRASSLVWRERPDDERFAVYGPDSDGFECFVERVVLDYLLDEMRRRAPNETIGILAGRACQDALGPYLLVLAADGARPGEAEAGASHVRISGDGNTVVRERLARRYPAYDHVGWWHSHPRYEPRFSGVDVGEQRTWSNPNHVGIVVSGLERTEPIGVYRGPTARQLDPVTTSPFRASKAARRLAPPALHAPGPHVEPANHMPLPTKTGSAGKESWLRTLSAEIPGPHLAVLTTLVVVLQAGLVWFDYRIRAVERSFDALRASVETREPSGAGPATSPSQRPAAEPTRPDSTVGKHDDSKVAADPPKEPRTNPAQPPAVSPEKPGRPAVPTRPPPARTRTRNKSATAKSSKNRVPDAKTSPKKSDSPPKPASTTPPSAS